MPQATYIAEGRAIDHTPGSAKSAGDVVVIANRCFIAVSDIAANALGAVYDEGVFDVTKQASLAIAEGASVFWDDSANEADKTTTNVAMGVAVKAAGASDSTVRVKLNGPRTVHINDLPTIADLEAGVPFIIRALCTAGGAEDEVVMAAAPCKALVCNAWLISKDTSAANVTLKHGSTAFTNATAKGTTSAAYVNFGQIVEAAKLIPSGAAIAATFSGAASAEIFILCLPVA